jgi:hypothetical protein
MVHKNCELQMAGIILSLGDKFQKATLNHVSGAEASLPFLVWQLLTSVLCSGYFKNLLTRKILGFNADLPERDGMIWNGI